ncbi:MAG: SHOCT domain-containing protein [Desulfovibrionaceae bacterium]|nr:SHOCT domain-containing protein [Desulfovibrionaceae bacterium]
MDLLTTAGSWCGGPGFWQFGGGHGWGGWFLPFHFGGVLPILALGLVVYFTVRMFRKPASQTGPDDAEEILRERFARGEIDAQAFHAMKKELGRP